MTKCCAHSMAMKILYPEVDFLNFQVIKGWKYQKVMTGALAVYVVFTIIELRSVPYFYGSIDLVVRCAALLWVRRSPASKLGASCVCAVCDTLCQIMAHPETQNTMWLPIYAYLPGNSGSPPCPQCFPKLEGSWLFGIVTSYIVLFILPFRHSLLTMIPCFGLYSAVLFYGRWTNYARFSIADDVEHHTWFELILLSGMVFFNFLAKLLMQCSEIDLWQALKESRRSALDEKILRCQAEHKNEHMKTVVAAVGGKPRSPSIFEDSVLDSAASEVGHHPAPASLMSAPPILEREPVATLSTGLLQSPGTCSHGGDCLQENDTVWTHEAPHPVPVKDLVAGQHVLCYDHLSKGIKYAEVLNVAVQSNEVQWATVTLTDGTSLSVTADHPFLTESPGKYQQGPVRASDLKPRMDKVLVMKAVPVDVQAISLQSWEEMKEQAHISISICQPARHSLLVSRADKFLPVCAMAVGASNVGFGEEGYDMRTNNTFLNFVSETPILRRSSSDPGNLGRKKTADIKHEKHTSITVSGSRSTPSSILSVVTPSSADECQIRVGSSFRPVSDASGFTTHTIAEGGDKSKVGLQEYIELQRSGLPSIGSFIHVEGSCTSACWFENQQQHGRLKKCTNGLFCDRCHFSHDFRKRSRRPRDAITNDDDDHRRSRRLRDTITKL